MHHGTIASRSRFCPRNGAWQAAWSHWPCWGGAGWCGVLAETLPRGFTQGLQIQEEGRGWATRDVKGWAATQESSLERSEPSSEMGECRETPVAVLNSHPISSRGHGQLCWPRERMWLPLQRFNKYSLGLFGWQRCTEWRCSSKGLGKIQKREWESYE